LLSPTYGEAGNLTDGAFQKRCASTWRALRLTARTDDSGPQQCNQKVCTVEAGAVAVIACRHHHE
jgi:hypothetical protein